MTTLVNAKYLREFPQIKSCEVMLRYEPEIEEMVKTYGFANLPDYLGEKRIAPTHRTRFQSNHHVKRQKVNHRPVQKFFQNRF